MAPVPDARLDDPAALVSRDPRDMLGMVERFPSQFAGDAPVAAVAGLESLAPARRL